MMSVDAVLPLPPGLVAVSGDERSGKTTLLRALADACGGCWLDLALPGQDDALPSSIRDAQRARWPRWDPALHADLVDALGLGPHLDKKLFMLSTGSRRKVAIAALLASGAPVTCLDQPFAALDAASAGVIRDFLADMAQHASRTWVVADYAADARLAWRREIQLGA